VASIAQIAQRPGPLARVRFWAAGFKDRDTWAAYAFLLPFLIGFVVFIAGPMVASLILSFTDYSVIETTHWVGTQNYHDLVNDPKVATSLKNTFVYTVLSVPLHMIIALGLAVLLLNIGRAAGFFRTVFYLPTLAPPVAATMAFVYLLNPATGPVNTILGHLGIDGPLWFQSPQWSKPSLTLLSIWGVGNIMIIFLAAILDAPRQLYESAELDGAGPFQRLRWVTLPTISPVILFAVVISVIAALQYFTQAYVAANIAAGQASQAGDQTVNNLGYPEGSTLFYPVLLYQHGFKFFNMGYASALSVLLLVVAFTITVLIIRNSRRWVHYAGAGR
jgi:multiple sugar transport system permease protein